MKLFSDLLQPISILQSNGFLQTRIEGIAYDSRAVKPGFLFIALKGDKTDGHEYLEQAAQAGAAAFLVERPLLDSAIPWAQVKDTRAAMALIAQSFHDDPTKEMLLAGVTGTNGKTTTTYLVRSILRGWGKKTALVGTLGAMLEDEMLPLNHTTPEAPDLMAIFAQAREMGAQAGVMEVSSHGLELHRVQGCRFDVGVFTNLTQDHLDYHGTMENYAQAKTRLFTELAESSGKPFTGVINLDDEYGKTLAQRVKGKMLTYGTSEQADVRALNPQVSVNAVEFDLESPFGNTRISVPVGGRFNLWNSLAAISTGLAMNVPLDVIAHSLAQAKGVPGRFESIDTQRDFNVLVDYAHTPDALEKLLATAKELHPKRLVVIFGCGGNRDTTKRPKMGRIASELADRCIVTSDNPRKEDPERIIADILPGIAPQAIQHAEVEPDRRKAIQLALQTAQSGDLIVIAGKGHEDYQIIGETKYPFDDRQIVRELLNAGGEK